MKNQAHDKKMAKFRSSLIAIATVGVASFTWWLTSSEAFAPNLPLSSFSHPEVAQDMELEDILEQTDENIEQLEQDRYQELDTAVQTGDTLISIFERYSLQMADLYEILQLKQFKPQLSHLQPEQKLYILHDDQGHVVDLTLHLGADKELQIYKNDFGFDGEVLQDGEPVLASLAQHSVVDIETTQNIVSNVAHANIKTAAPVANTVKNIPEFESNRLKLKVKSGDTLYKIFRQYQLSLGDLARILKLNRQARQQLQNLKIDQQITIERTDKNHIKTLSLAVDNNAILHFTKNSNSFKGEIEKNGTRVALGFKPKKQPRQQQVAQQSSRNVTKKVVPKKLTSTKVSSFKQNYEYPLASSPELNEMIQNAKKYLGYPYVYGGQTPRGFDCSGFVVYNSKKAGISHLPRTAHQQYKHTKPVSRSNLQPGDLVFFHSRNNRKRIGHVGIYIGDDKFIHARAKGPKDVTITSLNNSYYRKHFVRGGRL